MNPGLYGNSFRFLTSFGMTRGCREQGMAVIPNVALRNEESLNKLII